WSTMVLMVFFSSRISPFTSTVILRERSPRATAVVTSAMLRTWAVKLPAIELTLSVRSFQVPATPGTLAWPPSRPSVPTSRATRDRGRDFGDVADLGGQIARHRVDAVGEILPGAGDAGHLGLAAQLAVGADFARHARDFAGKRIELIHHGVEGFLQLKDFTRH